MRRWLVGSIGLGFCIAAGTAGAVGSIEIFERDGVRIGDKKYKAVLVKVEEESDFNGLTGFLLMQYPKTYKWFAIIRGRNAKGDFFCWRIPDERGMAYQSLLNEFSKVPLLNESSNWAMDSVHSEIKLQVDLAKYDNLQIKELSQQNSSITTLKEFIDTQLGRCDKKLRWEELRIDTFFAKAQEPLPPEGPLPTGDKTKTTAEVSATAISGRRQENPLTTLNPSPTAARPANHYIVLFDASGSMKRDHAASFNFWQGKTANNRFMAEQLGKLVAKALREPPLNSAFSPIGEQDFFSFLLFNLDYDRPSYRLSRMFLTNSEVLLREGLPPSVEAYESFDLEPRSGKPGSQVLLQQAFRGFSPIVAATTAALPYIGRKVAARYHDQHVNRTFLIRITDGSFNAEANARDEYAVILRTIDSENRKGEFIPYPDGYPEYRQLARRISSAFDIGAQAVDCVLITHRVRNPFSQPFDCRDDAFTEIKDAGIGFLISYVEAVPRRPSLDTLARVEKQTLELQREAREGAINYVGTNTVQAAATGEATISSVRPVAVQWKLDAAGEWQDCPVEDGIAHCHENDEVRFVKDRTDLPKSLHYRFFYEYSFIDNPPMYPLIYRLKELLLPVNLKHDKTDQGSVYYSVPDMNGFSWAWLNPLRLLGLRDIEISPEPITDQVLVDTAVDRGLDSLTPVNFASNSREDLAKFTGQQGLYNMGARVFYGSLFTLTILIFLFWPRRALEAEEGEDLTGTGLLLDFNGRNHEQTALISTVHVFNVARSLNKKPFKITLMVDDPQFSIEDNELEQVPLAFSDARALVAVGAPGQQSLEDARAVDGNQYPLFFDPRAIQDCRLQPIDEGHELGVRIFAAVKSGRWSERALEYQFKLLLHPEHGRLKLIPPELVANDGTAHLETEYRAGEQSQEVCRYHLRNDTRFQYSLPVEGNLRISAKQPNGNPLDYVVRLLGPDNEPRPSVSYTLRHGEELPIPVVLDFTLLSNPIERNTYLISVHNRIDNSEHTVDEWQLVVCRAADRTAVSMRVLDNENNASPALNEDRPTIAKSFALGSHERPIPLSTEGTGSQNKTELFKLRLANACRDGFGFARWRCHLEATGMDNFRFAGHALKLVDERGTECEAGELHDSPRQSERERILTAEVQNRAVEILRQTMSLQMLLRIDWEVYKDGQYNPTNVDRFSTELELTGVLKHRPPHHVLAVDFGTSALAIAHAVGPDPEAIMLLPLQRRLQEIQKQDNFDYRFDDAGLSSSFLCSECNVNLDEKKLETLSPDSEDFLTLPLRIYAARNVPEKVFLSLKALISAGYRWLPLNPAIHPYLNSDGILERTQDPPLDEVILGAYRGLVKRFVEPILASQGKQGFSHVLVSHPNTYTQNHVRQLRQVVEQVFAGYTMPPNIVYPENIHFFSESDAVAYYYLIHAKELNGHDWSRIPTHERILIYDIGAGTLDLTYLEVVWYENPYGGKTPEKIRIKHRAGVNRAGNLLDECIARDLHERLTRELKDELYVSRIVVDEKEAMDSETRQTMDVLRQEIHKLKVDLAKGDKALRVRLTPEGMKPIVEAKGGDTPSLYEGCTSVNGTLTGEVFWEPTHDEVLNGRYANAFIEQVTENEIWDFFSDNIPRLDTIIVSGRTSLWPGFEERLKTTLSSVPHWVNFDHDPETLKRAVVLGVLERQFRWQDLKIEDPGIIGDFGVEYERTGPYEWHFHKFANSGDTELFHFDNASQVRIGIRTSNGFQQCFAFIPMDFYEAKDKILKIKLIFDKTGYLEAEIKNSCGRTKLFRDVTGNVAMLSYKDRPWPLGESKLSKLELGKLMQ